MTQEQLIRQTLTWLQAAGVAEACVAAGARNAPLVAALADSPGLRIWPCFEERSAGFFALGRIRASGRPVAVVTTSGTAAAELLPAVIEAFYQGLALVVITADRPRECRGTGAPQAIEQVGLFGPYTEGAWDWAAEDDPLVRDDVVGSGPQGPWHLNLCLREPLNPVPGMLWRPVSLPAAASEFAVAEDLAQFLDPTLPTLVLAGGLTRAQGAQAAEWMARAGLPCVAECTANLGGGKVALVRGGEWALKNLKPQQVIRLGGVPGWRWWRDLDERAEVRVAHVSALPFSGMARRTNQRVFDWSALRQELPRLVPVEGGDAFLERALRLEQLLEAFPRSEPAWARAVARQAAADDPSDGLLFAGNSLPIRELSLVGVPETLEVLANRGANGIDGLVSTFLGAAAQRLAAWMLVGDLSALYDLAGLFSLRHLTPGRRRIAVMNNGGGRIFSRVASLRALPQETRELVENRHQTSFEGWAKMAGIAYLRWEDPAQWVALPGADCVIEIVPDEDQTEAFWAAWDVD